MKEKEKNRKAAARRRVVFPEQKVGFPECNDASVSSEDRERIHVDVESLKLSRKSGRELKREESE